MSEQIRVNDQLQDIPAVANITISSTLYIYDYTEVNDDTISLQDTKKRTMHINQSGVNIEVSH